MPKRSGKSIIALTVQKILDEEIAKKSFEFHSRLWFHAAQQVRMKECGGHYGVQSP